jgi:hypothetical protein
MKNEGTPILDAVDRKITAKTNMKTRKNTFWEKFLMFGQVHEGIY